jgi:hypothetical protein
VPVLKGDLATTSLPAVLRSLADSAATGCLRIQNRIDEDARVYLRGGDVYAVVLPGRPPRLGARLVASGELDRGDLAEASEAQRTELQGWRLGELLVHLGYVEQPVVEAFVSEQLREAAAELMLWSDGRWKFRAGERTREDVAPPVPVDDLLADVDRHRAQWDALAPVTGGALGVPVLSTAGTAPETQRLDPEAWSLLCTIDGERSLAALAAASGLTLYEAGRLLASLVEAGLVEVEPAAAPEPVAGDCRADEVGDAAGELPVGESPDLLDERVGSAPIGVATRLADALKGLAPAPVAMAATPMPGEDVQRALDVPAAEAEVDTTIERASEQLAAALGPATGELDQFPVDGVPRSAPVPPLDAEQAQRRARDARELIERQAELEAARVADEAREQADRAGADEAREQQRLSAEIQAEAFAELTAVATHASPVAEPTPEQPAAPAAEPAADELDVPDEPAYAPRGADTAALLRELSSLGLEDERAPVAVAQPRETAATAATASGPKKRKGLFGRG